MLLRGIDLYSPPDGVYCSSDSTAAAARKAINMCKRGNHFRAPTSETSHTNWAVEFGSAPFIWTGDSEDVIMTDDPLNNVTSK